MGDGLKASEVVLGIHGGTALDPSKMTTDLEKRLLEGLRASLEKGFRVLQRPGASSLDAVEATVRSLENAPEFNSGRGAAFNHEGQNELDAAIMEGCEKKAGALAGVTHLKNPITAARTILEKSQHVFLMGAGAEEFARLHGVETVDPSYFRTEARWQELQEALAADTFADPHQWGTVGAVAVDASGTVAAATSTGGLTNKRFGRIGDTPVLGAGTYADNRSGAVSATGHGEFFIRFAVAHEILSLIQYRGLSVADAADEVINKQLAYAGGKGGVIVLDPQGNFAMARNCAGLYRGYVTRKGDIQVFIY
jgi:beta-aspartyl-peptidase (threonine type)